MGRDVSRSIFYYQKLYTFSMFIFTVIAALLCIATGVNTIASVVSWRKANTRPGFYFAVGITCATFWTLASALDYAAIPIPLKIFFAKWEYIFYHASLAFHLLFLLFYAGYVELAESKLLRFVLLVGCGINILLAWTNELHGWLWIGFSPGQFGNNTVIFEHGPAYLWVTGTGYLLYGSILLTAWLATRHGSRHSRRQGWFLFFAFLLPLLGNLVYQFESPELKGMDWANILISVSSIMAVWVLYGTRLLDIIPIAREKLLDSLSDGMMVVDTQGRIVDINQSAASMLGSLPDKMIASNLDEVLPLAKSFSAHPPEPEIRTEIEVGDSEKRYFDVLITPLFENKTVFIGRLIIFRDMTSRKQNELHMLQLSRVVEQSPTSIAITDLDGNITYVNPHFSALTGYTFDESIGQNIRILKSGHTPLGIYTELWQTIVAGKIWKGEFLNKKKNGDLYWAQATIAPVFGPDGKILNLIAIKEDITEQKLMAVELERLASTDSLTGMINRRELIRRAEIELERARRYQHPTAAIMLDVDHFKKVNDSYGHAAGDRVLVMLAQLLTRELRVSDLVARYGGEEFMLVLPETPLDKAINIAERIRDTVTNTPVMVDGQTIRVTISLGVTSSESAGQDFESLLKAADRLLYQAKQLGRNRVAASSVSEII